LPEGPEVRIMSDFINTEIGHRRVDRVEKSPMFKTKCDFSALENKDWKMKSFARGKEMIIEFTNCDDTEEIHYLKINFAKIGSMLTYNTPEDDEFFDRRAMVRFYSEGKIYCISDFTRFLITRWSSEWDTNRSPDVATQHNEWRDLMYEKRNIAYFKRPIFQLLTDQRFFNGIGNFSRSEILARTRFSPFTTLHEILSDEILRDDFFQTTKDVLNQIHRFGGFQFKHWINPFGKKDLAFNKWVRAYNKPRKAYFIKDTKGAKFWFIKRWDEEYAEWVGENDILDPTLLKKIYSKNKQKRWQ
jgi:endonuclease VIII-like 1